MCGPIFLGLALLMLGCADNKTKATSKILSKTETETETETTYTTPKSVQSSPPPKPADCTSDQPNYFGKNDFSSGAYFTAVDSCIGTANKGFGLHSNYCMCYFDKAVTLPNDDSFKPNIDIGIVKAEWCFNHANTYRSKSHRKMKLYAMCEGLHIDTVGRAVFCGCLVDGILAGKKEQTIEPKCRAASKFWSRHRLWGYKCHMSRQDFNKLEEPE